MQNRRAANALAWVQKRGGRGFGWPAGRGLKMRGAAPVAWWGGVGGLNGWVGQWVSGAKAMKGRGQGGP